MSNFIYGDYVIPDYCLSYLINGDLGDLTDEEISKVDNFFQKNDLGSTSIEVLEELGFKHYNHIDRYACNCSLVRFTK